MKKTAVRSRVAAAIFISFLTAGCGKSAEQTVDLTEGTLASRTSAADAVVSGGVVSEAAVSGDTLSADSAGEESLEAYIAVTGKISFANMTGRNLTELEVQFSSGDEQRTMEILQGETFYDGSIRRLDKGDYSILWENEGAGITARAVDTAGNVLEFPEIYLWTPDDVCFSLTRADDGYALYVE